MPPIDAMKPAMKCAAAGAFVVIAFATAAAYPANIAFTPGDAFFHSELTEEFLSGLKADASSITLLYEAPKGSLALSGARGIARMEITAPSKHFIKGLRTAYEQATAGVHEFRESKDEDGRLERDEIDPPHLFIYNRDIDLKSQVIGLKYNESWHSLPDEAFQGAERGIEDREIYYESFLKPKNAILEDWKNAERFSPLNVIVPKGVAWGVWKRELGNEAVKCDASSICAIVVEDWALVDCFRREDFTQFFIVSNESVTECHYEEGRLRMTLIGDKDTKSE